nr:MAG TPA: tail protein [Caudoviricetes sp.]
MPFTKSEKYVEVINVDNKKITAKPENVEQGKLYVGSTKRLEIGTMPVHDEHGDVTLLAGETQNFPVGKIPKEFNVIAAPLAQQTIADADTSSILDSRTAWVNGQKITGTIPTYENQTVNIDAGEEHGLPSGYYKECKVIGAALAGQTDGTANDSDILSGKIAWVNGQKITGIMKKNIPINVKIGAGETYNLEPAYYQGGKITSSTIVEATVADATANDIILNKTAWVNGQKITGNIQNIVPTQYTIPVNGTYNIPKGFHSGLGSVTQNVETMDSVNITPSVNTQRIASSGKYMIGDIIVSPVTNAVNFEIPDDTFIIDKKIEAAISSFHLPVDNWHDNATMNIYDVSVEVESNDGTNRVCLRGAITLNWKTDNTIKGTELCSYILKNDADTYETNPEISIKCKAYINTETMAHTFEIKISPSLKINTDKCKFKVKELFRARGFGRS